jgi:hypothetical protein
LVSSGFGSKGPTPKCSVFRVWANVGPTIEAAARPADPAMKLLRFLFMAGLNSSRWGRPRP